MRFLKIITLQIAPVIIVAFLFLLFPQQIRAQPPAFKMLTYIESYSEVAVRQMVTYKIPASVILAQAIFESRNGESELAKKSNNHFGIKCHLEWGGDTVIKHDDTLNECFRKYENIEDSYTDHSMFLCSRARYAQLFDLPINDYKGWCYGLKASGYATHASYAEDLINLIERTKLYELDGCEFLQPVNVFNCRQDTIQPVTFNYEGFFLRDFYKTELLWTDERDILIQSLELLIEKRTEELSETSSE